MASRLADGFMPVEVYGSVVITWFSRHAAAFRRLR